MNKKKSIMVTLLIFAILCATLVGIAQSASYRGSWRKPPTIAAFEVTIQTWPDMESIAAPSFKSYLTDEGDMVMKNFRLVGIPPLPCMHGQDPTFPDDFLPVPRGGIRLTINGDYTLIGTFEKIVKINIFFDFDPGPPTGVYAVGKWSFEITGVESGTAPANAVGSTMSGWYSVDAPDIPMAYISTKGTGMFKGAYIAFSTSVYFVTFPPGIGFASEEAEGNIIFP